MKKYIVSFLISALVAGSALAQGWQYTYGGGGQDAANDVAQTPDGGYIMAGYYGANQRIYLVKTDADGQRQWSKTFTPKFFQIATSVLVSRDSGYVIAGWVAGVNQSRDVLLMKTDSKGNLLWKKQYGSGSLSEEGRSIIELPNGDFMITGLRRYGNSTEDALLIRTNAQGDELWLKTFGDPNEGEIGVDLTLMSNGDVAIASHEQTLGDIRVMVVDLGGNILWERTYEIPDALGVTAEETPRAITESTDGNLILAGFTNVIPSGGAGFLMKISTSGMNDTLWTKAIPNTDFYDVAVSSNGDIFATGYRALSLASQDLLLAKFSGGNNPPLVWEALVGRGGPDQGYAVLPTRDGGAVAAGSSYEFVNLQEELPYLVKADKNGLIYTSFVQATVFRDLNENCTRETGEPALRDWIVKIEGENGFLRYGVANSNGRIQVALDTGNYLLSLVTPNSYWTACSMAVPFSVLEFYDTAVINLAIRPAISCPNNKVDIATPILRRCSDNVYTVQYCNTGTSPSANTRVEVTLDRYLTLKSSSIPAVSLGSNKFSFNVGNLPIGFCGSFSLTAFLACDSLVSGQVQCVSAHIYPDSFCNPAAWNGAYIVARGECDPVDKEVHFYLKNTGTNPTNPVNFIIVEDIVMLDQFQESSITGNSEKLVFSTNATGQTYRIIADQVDNYPGLSFPTAAVEGCKSDTSDNFSTGTFTMFPEDDMDYFVEYDCQENIEPDYNPSAFFKRGHPKGYGLQHFVRDQTDLEYLIAFENKGNDTVTQVIVRDTLSTLLNPTTVQPGVASHPYEFQLYGNGIIQFTLPNAQLLPASSTGNNSGFVSFRVQPLAVTNPEISCETPIYNKAAIYFDFNAPVVTDEIFHTVCPFDSFIVVKTKDIQMQGADVRFAPNPFTDFTYVDIRGVAAQTYRLQLFDIQGQLLFNQIYSTPTFRLYRNALPSGVAFYRIEAEGRPVATGKLLIR